LSLCSLAQCFLGPLLGTGALDRPKKGRRYGTDFGDFLGRLGCDLDPNRHRRWSVYRSSFEALDLRTNQAVDTGASPTGGLNGELLTADAAGRQYARRAAHLIEQAEATLEEAFGVIANGYLRLGPGSGPSRSAGRR
jgi:hypothetical protein